MFKNIDLFAIQGELKVSKIFCFKENEKKKLGKFLPYIYLANKQKKTHFSYPLFDTKIIQSEHKNAVFLTLQNNYFLCIKI